MRKLWLTVFVLIAIMAVLTACSQGVSTEMLSGTPSPTLDGTLRPYPSGTPTQTPWPTGYSSPTPSPTMTLSPTPVYYEVMLGDDMYSIAFRYSISPELLMTANPTVNPRAMTVGTLLLIPITPAPETTPTATLALSPTATPQFNQLSQPDCYPDALGGLWCFVLVENDRDGALENVSGLITLTAVGEESPRQEVAVTPLNILPVGRSLPLVAYFQPPVPAVYTASAQVDFFLPVMEEDDRYLDAEIQSQMSEGGESGEVGAVLGRISIAPDQPPARFIWVSATAFDADGHVVAVRRWEAPEDALSAAELDFEISLYSLGGTIDRVDLIVEAQAALPAEE